jgi:hypothetical protein
MKKSIVPYLMNTWPLEPLTHLIRLLYPGARYVEIDIALVNFIICKNMSKHLPIFIVHSSNLWGMMGRIVGIMTSCMKGQGIHIEFKENYSQKEIMHNSTPQEEETSTLVVDSQEEDEVEVWVKVKVRLFSITTHSHEIWQGNLITLVLLVTIVIHSTMSLKIV